MAQLASILDSIDHHVAPLELVTNLAANALPHCLGLPLWPHHLALSWYLHQSKSPQLSFNNITGGQTSGPKDRTLKNRDGRTDGKLNSRSRITRGWWLWLPLSKQLGPVHILRQPNLGVFRPPLVSILGPDKNGDG